MKMHELTTVAEDLARKHYLNDKKHMYLVGSTVTSTSVKLQFEDDFTGVAFNFSRKLIEDMQTVHVITESSSEKKRKLKRR